MKPIKQTFMHRASCKWCHSIPTQSYVYHAWIAPRDIIASIMPPQDIIIETTFMGQIIKYKDLSLKLRLSRFSLNPDHVKLSPRFHRKSLVKEVSAVKLQRSCVSRCACGRSYWIDYYFDPSIYPENNRKYSVK